jgi:hypothetical protein
MEGTVYQSTLFPSIMSCAGAWEWRLWRAASQSTGTSLAGVASTALPFELRLRCAVLTRATLCSSSDLRSPVALRTLRLRRVRQPFFVIRHGVIVTTAPSAVRLRSPRPVYARAPPCADVCVSMGGNRNAAVRGCCASRPAAVHGQLDGQHGLRVRRGVRHGCVWLHELGVARQHVLDRLQGGHVLLRPHVLLYVLSRRCPYT